MPLFNEQFLVVDYGTTYIKGVLYENGPGGRRILRLESLPIVRLEDAETAREEEEEELDLPQGELTEYEYNVTRFVQSFFPEESNYLLNLSLDTVYVRDLVIPIVNAKQIDEVIPHEVENYIPVSLDEAEVIGRAWEIGEESSQVITFTAPNETLVQRVQPLLRGTTSVRMLSLDAVGLASFVQLMDPADFTDRVLGQIDIGGGVTILNIIKNGELVFSRQMTLGGLDVDRLIMDEYNVDQDMAEGIKFGLELDVAPAGMRPEKPEQFYKRNKIDKKAYEKLLKNVREVYRDIASEIERSLLSIPVETPEVFYLSGGASLVGGVSELLNDVLEIRVREYPLEMVAQEPENIALWATAIGTGEHYKLKAPQRLDFLNTPFGGTLRRGEFNFNTLATPVLFASTAIIVFLVSFLIGILLDRRQIRLHQGQILKVAKQIPGLSIKGRSDPIKAAQRLCRDRLRTRQAVVGGVRLLDVLDDLTNRTPAAAELKFDLKRFNYKGDELQFDAEVDNFKEVSRLQRQYQGSKLYEKVEIVRSDRMPNGKIRLSVKLNFKVNRGATTIDCK